MGGPSRSPFWRTPERRSPVRGSSGPLKKNYLALQRTLASHDHMPTRSGWFLPDLLGSLAGLSFPVVYVGVVECAPASPYTCSSSTHRFPNERTPIEATPLSATSAELVLGLGLGLGLGSHSSSHAPSHTPLLLATLPSHNIPLPRVH